ncbi:hypothetical protein Q8A73_000322 [Channa argus]|nr:hypothetical protein Q8A73_000322 [Channa argus]
MSLFMGLRLPAFILRSNRADSSQTLNQQQQQQQHLPLTAQSFPGGKSSLSGRCEAAVSFNRISQQKDMPTNCITSGSAAKDNAMPYANRGGSGKACGEASLGQWCDTDIRADTSAISQNKTSRDSFQLIGLAEEHLCPC